MINKTHVNLSQILLYIEGQNKIWKKIPSAGTAENLNHSALFL